MNAIFSPARLGALLVKEFIQMRRDRVTFAMMLGVPLMLLVLFGFAINNDPKSLPAALLALSNDPYSRAMVVALENTDYYRFDRIVRSEAEADTLLARGEVAFVVTIPADFGRRVAARRRAADPDRGPTPPTRPPPAAPSPRSAPWPARRCCAPRAWIDRHEPGGQASSRSSSTGSTIPRACRSTTSCPACSASSCR